LDMAQDIPQTLIQVLIIKWFLLMFDFEF
jgi:hypothetical protein